MGWTKAHLKLLLLTITLILVQFSGETSGQKLCRHGEKVCDGRCYNPERFQCLSDKLCRHFESLCARNGTRGSFAKCYDPTFEECHLFRSDEVVCLKGQSTCGRYFGGTCYYPEAQECMSNEKGTHSSSVLCLKGQKVCGESCYWPEYYQCIR